MGAVPQRGGVDQLADQVDAFMRYAGQVLRLEAGRHVSRQLVVPALAKGRLQRGSLDGLDARDSLHQHGLVLGAARKLDVQALAQDRHHGQTQAEVERQTHQHNQREWHAVEQHHRHKDDGEQHVQNDRKCVAGQKAADVFQFAHPRHRVADATRLEIGQRQPHQVPEQTRTELYVDAAGGMAEHIGAQGGQHALEYDHHHQADHQHVQRCHALVDQHLVHHDLKKQRAYHPKNLKHE